MIILIPDLAFAEEPISCQVENTVKVTTRPDDNARC